MNPLLRIMGGLRMALRRLPAAHGEKRMKVKNATRGTLLATRLVVADRSAVRSKGLLGRQSLPPGEGLWIVPCEAVHTFFMRFPIDLVYLDRHRRVRKLRAAVPPWRLSACLLAHSVLELPAGTIRDTQTRRGDLLEFSPAPADSSESNQKAKD
jgi:hypothetical protein